MPHPKNIAWAGGALAFGGVLFKVWLFDVLVRFGVKDVIIKCSQLFIISVVSIFFSKQR